MALYYAARNSKALGRPLSSLWRTKSFNYSSFDADLQFKLKSDAQTIFRASLTAVSPQEMVKNNLLFHQNVLSIKEREYAVDRNVSVVAFGKAVLGMAKAVDDILRDQIVRGVASIPVGLTDTIKVDIDLINIASWMCANITRQCGTLLITAFTSLSKLHGVSPLDYSYI